MPHIKRLNETKELREVLDVLQRVHHETSKWKCIMDSAQSEDRKELEEEIERVLEKHRPINLNPA